MSLKIKLLDYTDLSATLKEEWKYHKYATFLQVLHNEVEVAFHHDSMEPEDTRFYRDLSWVPSLITKAYMAGIQDGKEGLEKAALRYNWLRAQDWTKGSLVITEAFNLGIGAQTYSGERLDSKIDELKGVS